MNEGPTQAELAGLAATLATGNERNAEDFERLAERALAVWDGAGRALWNRNSPVAFGRRERDNMFLRYGIEPPEAGNFTLKEGLAILMPKKRDADRVKALRDFITETAERDPLALPGDGAEIPSGGIAVEDFTPRPTEERVSREMERLRREGFKAGQLPRFAERFLPWFKNYSSVKRRDAGRIGGKARSGKNKPKG